MKLNQLILPALALGVGATFLIPAAQETQAFTTIGGSLNISQRDFRVFNNFTGNSDNNNQTPDPQFPGYQGATMAIWKASVEWGSIAHGDGSGDPFQSTLGSGGANFDPSFQGAGVQVGGTNSNIHSQISGSNGGVLAFTETPISNGWRIRYYEGWNWSDGPGNNGGNQIDLQEVACHEYGHALGLGHSNVAGATMRAFYSGGTSGRSISPDDIAGVQFIYNPMNALKPEIHGLTLSPGAITITGVGFDTTGNEVWFTQLGAGGNGEPVKVVGVNSTAGGTSITVPIPANAGPGDVLVHRNGAGNGSLSNSWPTDLIVGNTCTPPVNYCTSNTNSSGGHGTITSNNDASLSANNFQLTAFGMPSGKAGIFFYGPNQTSVPFGEGFLCIAGSIQRLSVHVTDVFGFVDQQLDFNSPPFNSGPGGFNTTDALSVTYCN